MDTNWQKKLTDSLSEYCVHSTYSLTGLNSGECHLELQNAEEHFEKIEGVLPVYDGVIDAGKTEVEYNRATSR